MGYVLCWKKDKHNSKRNLNHCQRERNMFVWKPTADCSQPISSSGLVKYYLKFDLFVRFNCSSVMEVQYFSGTSGILLPYKNKSYFPDSLKDRSRLSVYSLLFNSLEVNSSFYKIPRKETVARWSQETSDNFRFTFKLWKGITHQKGLIFEPSDVVRFLDIINAVGNKKGCLLIQLPPSATFSLLIKLDELLKCIATDTRSLGWHICVEFRHRSWYCQETLILLNSYGMNLVLHDKDGFGINNRMHTENDIIYLRFHGPEGDYKGSYENAVLHEYKGYIKEWLAEGKEVYVYFNNTIGAAIKNQRTLEEYVKRG